jgi:hypothetical protein
MGLLGARLSASGLGGALLLIGSIVFLLVFAGRQRSAQPET